MQFIIALLWAAFIAVLHVLPGQDLTFIQWKHLFHLDKLFHFIVFAIGAWLLISAVLRQYVKHAFRYTFIAYAFYGFVLELVQGAFFDGRQADALDWIADVLGVLLALLLHQKIYPSETIKS